MKKIMRNSIMALAAMLATACTQDEFITSYPDDPNAVHITAQIGHGEVEGGFVTRSTPIGDTSEAETQFKSGDRISVAADGQGPVVYKLEADLSTWTPEGSVFLKWNSSSSMTFTAFYPVADGVDENTFTLPTDQSTSEKISEADYMTFTGTRSKTEGNNGVNLPMERKMTRIVVSPTLMNQFSGYDVTAVTVHGNTAGYSGGTTTSGDMAVKTFLHTDGKYYALLSPTTADDSQIFIDVTITKGEESLTLHAKGIPATTAGKSYTVNLTVGRGVATVSEITINEWGTGSITGGDADPVPYLTFSAESEQVFKMDLQSFTLGEGEYFEYAVGNGNWTRFTTTVDNISFGGNLGVLRLRGKSSQGTATSYQPSEQKYSQFSFANSGVNVKCTGDIRTLIDYTNHANASTSNARFCFLFYDCTDLTTAPKLPAMTLAEYCYYAMFSYCTALTQAPELPATTLAGQCYDTMFSTCTALTQAPELPATTLARYCYFCMFINCKNITTAPALPATTLASSCYISMFENCSKLSSVMMLAQDVNDDYASGWLDGAGTDASSRTLTLANEAVYNALTASAYCIPDIWKDGNATIIYKNTASTSSEN